MNDAVLFVVFLDHALNDGINLLFLSQVLLVSLLTSNVRIIDLLLDLTLVHLKVFKLSLILLAFHLALAELHLVVKYEILQLVAVWGLYLS